MSSYGYSTFGYKVLIFVLLILLLVFGYVAVTLYLTPHPETVSVTKVEVVTATPALPTELPEEAAFEQAQRGLDDLKALKAIFGENAAYQFSTVDGKAEAKWVPEADSLGSFPANGVRSYLTRVYQVGLGDDSSAADEAVVFLQSAPYPALNVECQAVMGTAELLYRSGEWRLSSFQAAMQSEDSLCLLPQIETVDFGAGFPGLVFHQAYAAKGETIFVDEYYLNTGEGYSMVFSLEIAHQNAAACPPGCFSTFSEVTFIPVEDAVDDLLVTTRGTQNVDGVVVVVDQEELFRFTDGKFGPVVTAE